MKCSKSRIIFYGSVSLMGNGRIFPRLIEIPVLRDSRGALAVIQSNIAGFQFKRAYYLFNVEKESERGSHAHKSLLQIFIAIAGSFKVDLDDGVGNTKTFELHTPTQALFLPPGYWRKIYKFSEEAVCLVLASEDYEESDYIRDYHQFLEWRVSK